MQTIVNKASSAEVSYQGAGQGHRPKAKATDPGYRPIKDKNYPIPNTRTLK